MVFGNHTSGHIWCLFFGLVCWIAHHTLGIGDVLHYVDDAFCATFSNDLSFYQPYDCLMPSSQAQFISLLDDIGIPHDNTKQQHGQVLKIIGFEVDI